MSVARPAGRARSSSRSHWHSAFSLLFSLPCQFKSASIGRKRERERRGENKYLTRPADRPTSIDRSKLDRDLSSNPPNRIFIFCSLVRRICSRRMMLSDYTHEREREGRKEAFCVPTPTKKRRGYLSCSPSSFFFLFSACTYAQY